MTLEGTLHDMPFADLFSVFRAGQRSGRLQVRREEERGLIFVGSGQVIDALLVAGESGEDAAYGDDALKRILSWGEASFIFEHDPQVSQRPRKIVRDAAWFFAAIHSPPRQAVTLASQLRPALPDRDATATIALSADEWRLLSALWMQRSISMACVELELDTHQVLPIAQALVDRGLLSIVETREPTRAERRSTETLSHIASAQPGGMPKSQLLQAIMRRVRTL